MIHLTLIQGVASTTAPFSKRCQLELKKRRNYYKQASLPRDLGGKIFVHATTKLTRFQNKTEVGGCLVLLGSGKGHETLNIKRQSGL